MAIILFAALSSTAQDGDAKNAIQRKPAVIGILDEAAALRANPRHAVRRSAAAKVFADWKDSSVKAKTDIDALIVKRKGLDPKSEEAQKLLADIQRARADQTSLALQLNERRDLRPIPPQTHSEIRAAVKTVCEREGIDLVLPIHDGRDRLLYFNEQIDITAAVVKELKGLKPE